ncbi:hypothetical protein FNV43_RR07848 [Rhamnella rubrinervis]|uniref:Pyridoxal phosphate homeostasis protein n=1 Tax=Rhamnella rubrinervis TaxID=2594499 RepID=A0A8K0HFP4_9ROSA|nr:hypothetical protein FNV43_RR07848 [Rhamnella rubrinervis]
MCHMGAETSSCSDRDSLITYSGSRLQGHVWQMGSYRRPSGADATTTNPTPPGRRNTYYRHHQRRHLSNAHGVLSIVGWGTLLPIGAITARYLRKFPITCDRWHCYHICCQCAGYVLGAIGWCIGVWVAKIAKQQSGSNSHSVLGTIIFVLSTIQMLSMCWQPRKDNEECRKWWDIFHRILGYALIFLVAANIFVGINTQSKWKWVYVTLLGALALTSLALENDLEQAKRDNEDKGRDASLEDKPDSGMATSAAMDGVAAAALRSLLHRVQLAAERSGRASNAIRVVAVSKTKPVSLLRQVYDAGHRCFGENYVQELVEKAPQLPEDVEWHFIGNLQSNKVKPLLTGVPNLAMVESVDDEKIANHLDRAVASIGRKPLKVLIQVNTSGETSKSGVEPSGCVELAKHVSLGCPNLDFCGLMTIGMLDYTSTPENFKTLAECRSEVCKALGISEEQCELSMGMSGDFELAIEMGSTNVRIGSTIFGAREYAKKQPN